MHRSGGYGLLAASALALMAACRPPPTAPGQQNGGASGQECARIDRPARPTVSPSVLLLLDASGTMNEDASSGMPCDGGCGAASKWAQATAALADLVAATETSASWGLKFFADLGSACGVSSGVAVPVGTGNAAAIANAIAARTNGGGVSNPSSTPTRAAVSAAASYLATLGAEGRKLIVLVTDGATNCGSGGNNADDSPAAIQAVADALSSGIPTIVVAAASAGGPGDAALTALATAGGAARASAPPAYTPLPAVGDLAGTLAALASATTDCVYALPLAPQTSFAPNIGVRVDGVAIPRDPGRADGWDWADASFSAVRIFGGLCDDLMAGTHETVSILFYCSDTK